MPGRAAVGRGAVATSPGTAVPWPDFAIDPMIGECMACCLSRITPIRRGPRHLSSAWRPWAPSSSAICRGPSAAALRNERAHHLVDHEYQPTDDSGRE
jgi:hypothetical protein